MRTLKKKVILQLGAAALAFVLLAGCGGSGDAVVPPTARPAVVETAGATTAITKFTTPKTSLSPTVIPTPSGISIYSPLLYSDVESAGEGEIWVHQMNSQQYTVFDLQNGTTRKVTSPPRCDIYLLPGTTQVLCDQEGNLILYDLSKDVSESLNINTPDWVSSSSSGKHLILGHAEDVDTGPQRFQIYDLENRKFKYDEITIDVSDWYGSMSSSLAGGSLTLSPDGDLIAFVWGKDEGEYFMSILDLHTETYLDLDVGESPTQFMGSGLSWAPVSNHLIYGSVNLTYFDIYFYAMNVYLIKVETNEVTPVILQEEKEISYNEFWGNHIWFPNWFPRKDASSNSYLPQTWSPDGSQVLLIASSKDKQDGNIWPKKSLCFYKLITKELNCYEIWNEKQSKKYYNLFNVAWSSSSEEVVFFAATRFPRGDLFIFNPNLDQFILLEENIQIDGVFWR